MWNQIKYFLVLNHDDIFPFDAYNQSHLLFDEKYDELHLQINGLF